MTLGAVAGLSGSAFSKTQTPPGNDPTIKHTKKGMDSGGRDK